MTVKKVSMPEIGEAATLTGKVAERTLEALGLLLMALRRGYRFDRSTPERTFAALALTHPVVGGYLMRVGKNNFVELSETELTGLAIILSDYLEKVGAARQKFDESNRLVRGGGTPQKLEKEWAKIVGSATADHLRPQ